MGGPLQIREGLSGSPRLTPAGAEIEGGEPVRDRRAFLPARPRLAEWIFGTGFNTLQLNEARPMTQPAPKAKSALAPLRHPVFRALWTASVISHIGSYMTDVGQGWLMTTLSASPLLVALLVTAESLPFFALGLPAGALADILDRRRLLLATQLAMALVLAILAGVTLTGAITPWLLLLLAFSLGTASALNDPAWHSAVPELLPKDELPL